MIGAGLGPLIDEFETVIRFTVRNGQTVKDFGTKTDIIVTSQRNHSEVIVDGILPRLGTWVMTRPHSMDDNEQEGLIRSRIKRYKPYFPWEHWPWVYEYKDMGAIGYIDPKQGEPGMWPMPTQGTLAIIVACDTLKPSPSAIYLVGFDNIWAGQRERYQNTWYRERGRAPKTSGHDPKIEKRLIMKVGEYYGIDIKPLKEWEGPFKKFFENENPVR